MAGNKKGKRKRKSEKWLQEQKLFCYIVAFILCCYILYIVTRILSCYILALILPCFLMLLALFQVVAFVDLNKSYDPNPNHLCCELKWLVLLECTAHVILTILFLYGGPKLSFVLNVPLLVYHFFRYKYHPFFLRAGSFEWITVVRLCNRNYANEGIFKLVFYFFVVVAVSPWVSC